MVAVGAYRSEDGRLADFSPTLPWVTVTAPGVDVVGAFPEALIELSDGTAEVGRAARPECGRA